MTSFSRFIIVDGQQHFITGDYSVTDEVFNVQVWQCYKVVISSPLTPSESWSINRPAMFELQQAYLTETMKEKLKDEFVIEMTRDRILKP
jgi:hypothetical protein